MHACTRKWPFALHTFCGDSLEARHSARCCHNADRSGQRSQTIPPLCPPAHHPPPRWAAAAAVMSRALSELIWVLVRDVSQGEVMSRALSEIIWVLCELWVNGRWYSWVARVIWSVARDVHEGEVIQPTWHWASYLSLVREVWVKGRLYSW